MDFFDEFRWHSSLEINNDISGRKIIKKLANTKRNRDRFLRVAKESEFLIHKSTKALWKMSEDGKSIDPVFDDDVLTEENL